MVPRMRFRPTPGLALALGLAWVLSGGGAGRADAQGLRMGNLQGTNNLFDPNGLNSNLLGATGLSQTPQQRPAPAPPTPAPTPPPTPAPTPRPPPPTPAPRPPSPPSAPPSYPSASSSSSSSANNPFSSLNSNTNKASNGWLLGGLTPTDSSVPSSSPTPRQPTAPSPPTPAATGGSGSVIKLPTVAPTPAPTPVLPVMPTMERKKALYETDSKMGTIYTGPDGDGITEDDDGSDPTSLAGGGPTAVRLSPVGNVNPGANTGFNDGHSGPRTGAANVGGADRVAFVGYKRISAINTDFNLPISKFDRFGSAIANLGDLDGDASTVEIAVGAPGDDTYVNDCGAVYIISLDKFTSIQNYRKIIPGEGPLSEEAQINSAFGTAIAPLGDFNGDGIMDIVVGAPYKDLTGCLYILYLTHGGQVKEWGKISAVFGNFFAPLIVGDEFGCSVANIGDLDKDGVPDLAVGACGDDDVKYGEGVKSGAAGAVYILFMKWDGTVKTYKKISARGGNLITGPKDGDRFGASIAFLGDLNKDGHPEIAVGAPMADIYTGLLSADMGEVYQLELLPSGDVKRFQIISPAYVPVDPRYSAYVYFSAPLMAYDYFGSSVGAIDVDKDGLYDLVVGSRGYDNVYKDLGNVYVIYLDWNGNLWTWEDVSATGLRLQIQTGEQFGASISFINDMMLSLLVGAPGEPVGSQGGSVYALRAVPM